MTDYNKMSLHELREVARVQAHELAKLKTTQFKDEFARRLGLGHLRQLRMTPRQLWNEHETKAYNEVSVSNQIGAHCWLMEG